MRKVFTAAATAAVAGVMALGLAAAPAQAASANAQATASSSAGYDFKLRTPKGEGYLTGVFFYGKPNTLIARVVDTPAGPRDYTYAEFSYVKPNGKRGFFRSSNVETTGKWSARRVRINFIKEMWVRVCEGNAHEYECSKWYKAYRR
jgi:hypothetical protein